MKSTRERLRRDAPAMYRIRVQGALDTFASEYLDNVTIAINESAEDAPVTVLVGRLVDQAALMGVLNNVYGLGYPLLSVECLDYG